MPTDPLTGSRYPQSSDSPAVAQHIQYAVFDLADNTIPSFATTTARDAAYSSWVAAGGVMRDGLFCVVGATLYKYQSGVWYVGEPKGMRAQRITSAPLVDNAWTAFGSATNWTETDPYNLHGTGGQVTAAYTGLYQINVVVQFNNHNTGRRAIRLNPATGVDIGMGSAAPLILDERAAVTGGTPTTLSGSHLTPLTAGAVVMVEAYQNSGASLDVLTVMMSAAYLGPN